MKTYSFRSGILVLPATMQEMTRRTTIWYLTGLLFLASFFRIIGLVSFSPPGLSHDEVANWLIDQQILAGTHAVYFTDAYGHEAGYHYVQALFVALLGDHALALRLPSAFLGILLVSVGYSLTKRLWSKHPQTETLALWVAIFLAVHLWPVFYSRQAIRAISLPVLSGLMAYFWWQGWQATQESTRRRAFALAGFLAGATLYTYMAARVVPIFFLAWFLYLFLFHKTQWRWRDAGLFTGIATLVALPLVWYLWQNPGAEFRVQEVSAPLQALRMGDIQPLWQNGIAILGMFGWSGDPLWRQYIAQRPLFEPIFAILFYIGVGLCLWQWKKPRWVFIGLWISTAIIPSLVTINAPSTIRMINILPLLFTVPTIVIHMLSKLSTFSTVLSTRFIQTAQLLTLLFYGGWTAEAVFYQWPAQEEVRFVWQEALTETAVHLQTQPLHNTASIGGWSPATMDAPTMHLSLQRDDLNLRYFGSDSQTEPIHTLIVPPNTQHIYRPTARELAPALETHLRTWSQATEQGSITIYEIGAGETAVFPQHNLAQFAEQLTLQDVQFKCDESVCTLITYWQVEQSTTETRRFFAHALNAQGDILAQHDNLDAPAMHWQPNDWLIQHHPFPASQDITQLRLGVYDPASCPACQNLPTTTGQSFFLIDVQVTE